MKEITYRKPLLKTSSKTQAATFAALLFAVALVLSVVESMLPPLPIPVPGVKFGLSNIAVMYALFFLGGKQAYAITILKGIFVFITRGAIAGALSLSGGLLSITIMLVLFFIFKEKISYTGVSILGAVFHNIGQFMMISVIYMGTNLLAYLPVLLLSGVIAGIVTSTLLRFVLPALNRLA